MLDNVDKCYISPGYLSDHSFVTLEVDISQITRGPGYWKLNSTHLQNLELVAQINDLIEQSVSANQQSTLEHWDQLKAETCITFAVFFQAAC